LINIVCTHLNSGEIKSTSVDKLTDILVKSEPVVDIPKPKNWDVGEDSLEYNFLPVNLFDKIDLSVAIYVPYNGGLDFVYQYLDNTAWTDITGNENYVEESLGCRFSEIYRNMATLDVLEVLQSVYKDGVQRDIQLAVYDDRDLITYLEFSFVKYGNKVYGFSERKTKNVLTDRQLEKVLSEKDDLLKELQDRVRNNLQLVRSFIDIELYYHPDTPKENLKKTRNRITTMAIVHQEIYNSNDPFTLNNCDFIENALSNLFSAYECTHVAVDLDFDSLIRIDMDQAILIGLIINELAVNTIDFAFPDDVKGIFHVGVHKDDLGVVNIEIFDDGVGLPDGVNFDSPDNLGFTIIKSLVGQLNGSCEELSRDSGFGILIKY